MEPMKQCPNCGKYVAADRTYCMNCGTTLGIKCEACGKVVPLMTKVCPCGHSFVRKTKKIRKKSTVLPVIKKHAKPILLAFLALAMIAAVIFAAMPALSYEVITPGKREPEVTEITASGFSVLGYFLSFDHAGIEEILGMGMFKDIVTPVKLLLYAEGLGWLLVMACLVLLVALALPNAKRLGKTTSRRMILWTSLVLFGGALIFAADTVICSLVSPLMEEAFTVADVPPEKATQWAFGSAFPLVVLILSVLLMALHLFLHVLALSKEEESDALSLKTIISWPLETLGRRIRRRLRRKRAAARGKSLDEDEKTVTCTSRFTTYLILLGVSLVFTQALLSKVSNLFFWFMFLLPLPLLGYTLFAKSALTVTMLSDAETTEKEQPYTYEFRIDNRSPFAFPFIDAKVSIPQSNSVRCTERSVRLSMAPLSSYHMKNTVHFRFRGTYEIGVKCFYVYDFFRLFRVRVPIDNTTTVYVLPRRINLDDTLAQAISDSTARTVKSPLVVDRLEVSDIRDYQNGDSLKNIHWKLSSKSENFVVKDYHTGTSNETVVFCDMAAHFPDEPPKSTEAPAPVVKQKLTAEEKKAARAEAKAQKEAQKKKALVKKNRHAETADTHGISDDALEARLAQRQAVATLTDAPTEELPELTATETVTDTVRDVHRLAQPSYYDDMNEYLADGVVELTVATVLAELRQGHQVTLIWFDQRADLGLFAYNLRGADEFEAIYHQFATAPLCRNDQRVCSLTAVVSDIQSAKQLFVTSTMDQTMLSELTALPGVSDAGSFGSAEVILYNPEERFLYPTERASYLEGCREMLLANGLSLRTSGMIAVKREEVEAHG